MVNSRAPGVCAFGLLSVCSTRFHSTCKLNQTWSPSKVRVTQPQTGGHQSQATIFGRQQRQSLGVGPNGREISAYFNDHFLFDCESEPKKEHQASNNGHHLSTAVRPFCHPFFGPSYLTGCLHRPTSVRFSCSSVSPG